MTTENKELKGPILVEMEPFLQIDPTDTELFYRPIYIHIEEQKPQAAVVLETQSESKTVSFTKIQKNLSNLALFAVENNNLPLLKATLQPLCDESLQYLLENRTVLDDERDFLFEKEEKARLLHQKLASFQNSAARKSYSPQELNVLIQELDEAFSKFYTNYTETVRNHCDTRKSLEADKRRYSDTGAFFMAHLQSHHPSLLAPAMEAEKKKRAEKIQGLKTCVDVEKYLKELEGEIATLAEKQMQITARSVSPPSVHTVYADYRAKHPGIKIDELREKKSTVTALLATDEANTVLAFLECDSTEEAQKILMASTLSMFSPLITPQEEETSVWESAKTRDARKILPFMLGQHKQMLELHPTEAGRKAHDEVILSDSASPSHNALSPRHHKQAVFYENTPLTLKHKKMWTLFHYVQAYLISGLPCDWEGYQRFYQSCSPEEKQLFFEKLIQQNFPTPPYRLDAPCQGRLVQVLQACALATPLRLASEIKDAHKPFILHLLHRKPSELFASAPDENNEAFLLHLLQEPKIPSPVKLEGISDYLSHYPGRVFDPTNEGVIQAAFYLRQAIYRIWDEQKKEKRRENQHRKPQKDPLDHYLKALARLKGTNTRVLNHCERQQWRLSQELRTQTNLLEENLQTALQTALLKCDGMQSFEALEKELDRHLQVPNNLRFSDNAVSNSFEQASNIPPESKEEKLRPMPGDDVPYPPDLAHRISPLEEMFAEEKIPLLSPFSPLSCDRGSPFESSQHSRGYQTLLLGVYLACLRYVYWNVSEGPQPQKHILARQRVAYFLKRSDKTHETVITLLKIPLFFKNNTPVVMGDTHFLLHKIFRECMEKSIFENAAKKDCADMIAAYGNSVILEPIGVISQALADVQKYVQNLLSSDSGQKYGSIWEALQALAKEYTHFTSRCDFAS